MTQSGWRTRDILGRRLPSAGVGARIVPVPVDEHRLSVDAGVKLWLGVAVTVVLPVIYIPMLFVATGTTEVVEAVNYIFDSLLFAGSVFLLAGGMASGAAQPAPTGLARVRTTNTARMGEFGG